VISVVANVAPKLFSQMCRAALDGDLAAARRLNNEQLPLAHKLFVEPNPIPVKWALARMGRIKPGLRLPLVPLSAAAQPVVESALKDVGLM
jgi:4-hydroxy-tetrahydrodipicolinate synthase